MELTQPKNPHKPRGKAHKQDSAPRAPPPCPPFVSRDHFTPAKLLGLQRLRGDAAL